MTSPCEFLVVDENLRFHSYQRLPQNTKQLTITSSAEQSIVLTGRYHQCSETGQGRGYLPLHGLQVHTRGDSGEWHKKLGQPEHQDSGTGIDHDTSFHSFNEISDMLNVHLNTCSVHAEVLTRLQVCHRQVR